jgi:hypothetical protein
VALEAEIILRTLDGFLTGPGTIRLLGGAALTLGYGLQRATEDADLIMDDDETRALIEHAGLAEALVATNAALASKGLYLTHIWGPEQEPLTPDWRNACRAVSFDPPLLRLTVEVLGPLDLIASKLARGDAGDLTDIAHVMQVERLTAETVRQALDSAVVPEGLKDIFVAARQRLEAFFKTPRAG